MRNILKVVMVAGLAATAALSMARTEPNSFLNKPANTKAALLSQARNDSVVMSRFTRHFGKTREEMLSWLGALTPGTLSQDAVYLVYNVNNSEEIRARVMYYKRGTKVWMLNGQPVMKMSCANPMVRGTDDQLAVVQPAASMNDDLRAVMSPADPDPVPAEPTEAIVTIDEEPQALAAVAEVPGVTNAIVGGGSRFNPFFLAPLAGLGFIRRGGGNDGGGETPPPPVPEPFTMTAIGAGMAYMAWRKAKKAPAKN